MAPVEDKEETNVLVLSDNDDDVSEVKETNQAGDNDEEEFDCDEDESDDDDDDDDEEEDLGTEYLVRPVGEGEDEDDASEFNPEENDIDEEDDIDEEEVDEGEESINLSAGKPELAKRKRVAKDDNAVEGGVSGGDDERVAKR